MTDDNTPTPANLAAFLEEAHAVAKRYGLTLAWDEQRGTLLVRNDPKADVRMVQLRQPGDESPPRMPGIAVGDPPPTLTGLREVNTLVPHPPEVWEELLKKDDKGDD